MHAHGETGAATVRAWVGIGGRVYGWGLGALLFCLRASECLRLRAAFILLVGAGVGVLRLCFSAMRA